MECILNVSCHFLYSQFIFLLLYTSFSRSGSDIKVLQHMMLCKLGNSYSHSIGACLHIHGSPMVSSCTTLYVEAGNASQISANISQLKQLPFSLSILLTSCKQPKLHEVLASSPTNSWLRMYTVKEN